MRTLTLSLLFLLLSLPAFLRAQDTLAVHPLADSLLLALDTMGVSDMSILGRGHKADENNQWNNTFVNSFQNPAMAAYNNAKHNLVLALDANFYTSQYFTGQGLVSYELLSPMLKEKHPGKFYWGTGIYFKRMDYSGRFLRNQFGINHSFSVYLKNGAQLRAGLEFFNFYIHPLTETQVDGNIAANQGSGTRVRKGQLDGGVLGYGMLDFGLWYQTRKYFVGVSVNNANTLEGWHFGGDEQDRAMPMELYVHGGYHITIGPVVLTPMLEYYSKSITVQAFRPRLNVQSLGGRLLTGIGYGSKTVTANVGYRTKIITFNLEGGVSTHAYGPLRGGWVAQGCVIFHFGKDKPAKEPTQKKNKTPKTAQP